MSRQMVPFFHPGRPVYIKTPFSASGRDWKGDERFNWEFYQIPIETVKTLFDYDFLKHSDVLEEKTVERQIGDGLSDLSIDELQGLVTTINRKVREKTNSLTEYNRKKCHTSKIKDKQIGLIRRWRTMYSEME